MPTVTAVRTAGHASAFSRVSGRAREPGLSARPRDAAAVAAATLTPALLPARTSTVAAGSRHAAAAGAAAAARHAAGRAGPRGAVPRARLHSEQDQPAHE